MYNVGAMGWLDTRCLIVHMLCGSSIGYLAILVPVGSMHRLYMYFTKRKKSTITINWLEIVKRWLQYRLNHVHIFKWREPHQSSTSLGTRNKNGVGKVSQSLACKISHVWRDYIRGQWITGETTVVRTLCIGVNDLFRFPPVIFLPGIT